MADRMDDEQRQIGDQAERLLAITEELEKAQAQIRSLEEEVKRAKEFLAIQVNLSQENTTELEIVVPDTVPVQAQKEEPVTKTALEKEKQWDIY